MLSSDEHCINISAIVPAKVTANADFTQEPCHSDRSGAKRAKWRACPERSRREHAFCSQSGRIVKNEPGSARPSHPAEKVRLVCCLKGRGFEPRHNYPKPIVGFSRCGQPTDLRGPGVPPCALCNGLPPGRVEESVSLQPHRLHRVWVSALVHANPGSTASRFAGKSINRTTPITRNMTTSVKFLWTP